MRNGYKSHRGRSATARSVIMSGNTNSMMPVVYVTTTTGLVVRTSYFGGDKKGGMPPNATGFMTPSGQRAQMAVGKVAPASKPNYLFVFKTAARPWGGLQYVNS